jgi:hypothetical protein
MAPPSTPIDAPSTSISDATTAIEPPSEPIHAPSISITPPDVIDSCADLIDHVGSGGIPRAASKSRDARACFVDFRTVGLDGASIVDDGR